MTSQTLDFAAALPEMFVLGAACVILLADVYFGKARPALAYWLALVTLIIALIITVIDYGGPAVLTFNGHFVKDAMGDVLKGFIYISAFGVFLYSREYLEARALLKGEFFTLGLFAVLGMMIMVSGESLLTIYLGLELLSLSLYAMVALQRDSVTASEAAMKYFVLGALASGMLLYGMSMLYGATGSLEIATIGHAVRQVVGGGASSTRELMVVFGTVFIVVGVSFKLGAVPFHMWIPDVYHGAPTAMTLFVGTAPKLAAFAMVMRVLVEGLQGVHAHWQDMLIILAVASMGIGNIVAIAQVNMKRMLAYSTISHVGFLLLGILAGTPQGYASAMFYIITYALMALGGFGMILLLSRAGFEADRLEDFRGLNERSPWFAFMMLILMFSMAGVPPLIGFYAKWVVLQAVINVGLTWLAVVAVAFSIIGAFYYLRIVRLMYFEAPQDTAPLVPATGMRLGLSANGLALLGLGIFPGALMALCGSVWGI